MGLQILWGLIISIVPIGLILIRRRNLLLAWICLVTCVDVFKMLNVSAATVAGLILIPYTIRFVRPILQTRPGQLLFAHYGYLGLLGLVFGFLFPWPDALGRPLSLQAPGRTILYLTRHTANLSLAIFVAQQTVKLKHPSKVFKYILLGGIIAAAGGICEYLSGLDMFALLTEGVFNPTYHAFRVRGLNFEPRGLGLTAAYGLLLCMLVSSRRASWKAVSVLLINVCTLFLTVSTSGLLAATAGIVSLFLFDRHSRGVLVGVMAAGIVVLLIPMMFESGVFADWSSLLTERIGSTIRFGEATNWMEEFVFRAEVFDAVALLFLVANPIYILSGTGPGLISIPATSYLPETVYYTEFFKSTGINLPPTMGGLLELSNGGLIGLLLWIAFLATSLCAIRYVIKNSEAWKNEWKIARGAFLGAGVMYGVAAGFLSSFWPIFMGIGLGAACLRHIHRKELNEGVQS